MLRLVVKSTFVHAELSPTAEDSADEEEADAVYSGLAIRHALTDNVLAKSRLEQVKFGHLWGSSGSDCEGDDKVQCSELSDAETHSGAEEVGRCARACSWELASEPEAVEEPAAAGSAAAFGVPEEQPAVLKCEYVPRGGLFLHLAGTATAAPEETADPLAAAGHCPPAARCWSPTGGKSEVAEGQEVFQCEYLQHAGLGDTDAVASNALSAAAVEAGASTMPGPAFLLPMGLFTMGAAMPCAAAWPLPPAAPSSAAAAAPMVAVVPTPTAPWCSGAGTPQREPYGGSKGSGDCGAAPPPRPRLSARPGVEWRTTIMLRNLPNNYTRLMVIKMLDREGFAGLYDFLYLPMDFKTKASLGYCFVNLIDPRIAARCWKRFEGYSKWSLPSKKICYVSWSEPHQGLKNHIKRYRSSPVMHDSVPDEYKPVVFKETGN